MTRFCFGSPTSFNPAPNSFCQGCAAFDRCGPIAAAKIIELGRHIDVKDVAQNVLSQMQGCGNIPWKPVPKLPQYVQVSGLSRTFGRLNRKELTGLETNLVGTLPVKVAKRVRPLMRAGIFGQLAPELHAGRNPFPTTENLFFRTFAQMLLDTGQVIKMDARLTFREKFGWTDMTAASHVSVAVSLFTALGVATDRGDRLVRKPKPIA